MHGCYLQTEIGHGSNIRGLETRAEYDPATDEFVVNTPTITATKYWPGEVAFFATHGILMARLIVKDIDYGVAPFLIRLRDQDHQPLPGIELGDIGPKFG